MALQARIDHQIEEARKHFMNNPNVTVHENPGPFRATFDLNFPIYILENGKPNLVNGVKGFKVLYSSGYPDKRPVVKAPQRICSIHSWEDGSLCHYTLYLKNEHNLIKEIEHAMDLCANTPETINFNSMTPDSKHLKEWTEQSLRNGTIPTVKHSELVRFYPQKRRVRRTAIIL